MIMLGEGRVFAAPVGESSWEEIGSTDGGVVLHVPQDEDNTPIETGGSGPSLEVTVPYSPHVARLFGLDRAFAEVRFDILIEKLGDIRLGDIRRTLDRLRLANLSRMHGMYRRRQLARRRRR
jgi:hypothetical protein